MDHQDEAGRSADEWAADLRRRADALVARAERVAQGARGERRTAAVLDPRCGDGWAVLHDLAVPNSKANIDHIAVTSAGVFVIDSKDWSGRVTAGRGTLWVGRYPRERELETLRWEAAKVAAILRVAYPGRRIPVRAVISLTRANTGAEVLCAGDITAVSVDHLVRHLASPPAQLRFEQVGLVAAVLASGLGNRSAISPPRTPAPHAAPAKTLGPSPTRSRSAPGPQSRPFRSDVARSRSSAPRSMPKPPSELAKGLGALVVVGLVLLTGSSVLQGLFRQAGSDLSHAIRSNTFSQRPLSTSTPPTTRAIAASARPLARWSCPSAAAGWTATVAWPSAYNYGGTEAVYTSTTTTGPWHLSGTMTGTTSFTITALPANTTTWIKAGSFVDLLADQSATIEGPLTPPEGC